MPDLTAEQTDEILTLLAIMPDRSGKLLPEQKECLREFLFDKFSTVEGASDVIEQFRGGKLDNVAASKAMLALAKKQIEASGQQFPFGSAFTDALDGKTELTSQVAVDAIFSLLPKNKRLIAKAFLARRRINPVEKIDAVVAATTGGKDADNQNK